MIKTICVVSEGYPYKDDAQFSFVEELCKAFSRKGIRVIVISPQSIFHRLFKKERAHPTKRSYADVDGELITVYRPWCTILPYKFKHLNDWIYKKTVEWTFIINNILPDVCYGHFWNNGYYISGIAKRFRIPLFVASGEGNLDTLKRLYTSKKYLEYSKLVDGVICVSSLNKEISISYGLTTDDKCIVLPNAINHNKFYLKNKTELRKKYSISLDSFIVVFVGSFIHRKGSNRVSNAIAKLNDPKIESFFIGGGQGAENLTPTCKGVLLASRIPHNALINYLNMADVFVLPTLNEGCCNAIIEAMACGLPIISSDKPFNYDVLDHSNSILIDPLDINAIANAIKTIKDDTLLRKNLSSKSIITASQLEIDKRADAIIGFISSIVLSKNRTEVL